MTKAAILLNMSWEVDKSDAVFSDAFPDAEIIHWDKPEAHNSNLDDVKYAVAWGPEPGLLRRCANLEVIFSVGAGVDHLFKDPQLPDLPIVRFVDPDLTAPMVEWVVLQVLMHLRQQRDYDRLQRSHTWRELPQPQARNFRVGLMGFGELGQASAHVLKALGFKLNGWSRTQKSADGVRCYFGNDQLDEFLANTDILVSLLPLTDETRGILNRDLIGKLAKDGPFGAPVLINAGRGGSQVETDICDALENGALRGASLDVFETEPLPENSPLWDIDKLIITPHAAAISLPEALAAHVARQIARYEAGKPLEHLVDRTRGY